MKSVGSSFHKVGLFAFLLTATTAFAFTKPVAEQNVYNAATPGQPTNWQPLPSGNYDCNTIEDTNCTAHRDSQGNISDIQRGEFVSE